MTKLFYGNFSFEHQLAGVSAGELPRKLRRLDAELAAVWMGMAEAGDCIWMPERPDDVFCEERGATAGLTSSANGVLVLEKPGDFAGDDCGPCIALLGEPAVAPGKGLDELVLCPWGWSEEVVQFARENGWRINTPPLDVVRRANGRGFSFGLEQEFDCGPDGATVVESLDELDTAIGQADGDEGRWVVKAEFGMSARERILGQELEFTEADRNWIRKRLASDGRVYFEPWLDRVAEAGLQFTVNTDGDATFDGAPLLLTDPQGRYLGSRFALDAQFDEAWTEAIDVGLQAAARLAESGYFGPLGIDAMRYRDASGVERLRPLQDINARYTMGAIALGFRRLLQPGEFGSWLHVRWPGDAAQGWVDSLRDKLPHGVRMIVTSPFVVGDCPVAHGTLLLIADGLPAMQAAETVVITHPMGL